MADVSIEALPLPVFVIDGDVVVDANAAACDLVGAAATPVGHAWTDCFDQTTDGYAQLRDEPGSRWFRLDTTREASRATVVATDVTEEVHARAILEGLFADCFVLDREARLAWKLTPRQRSASSWSVDSHPIDQLHPDDLTASLERFSTALTDPGRRESFSIRVKHPTRSGHWEHVTIDSVSGVADPWIDGVVICSRVDEAIDTQLGLVDSPFYSLAEAAPTGIVVVDQRRHPVFLNEIARCLLGIDADANPEDWTGGFAEGDAAAVAEMLDEVFESDARAHRLMERRDGTTVTWIRVEAVAQHGAGGAVGAIVTLVDVTDVIEARADVDRLVGALQAGSDLVLVVAPDLGVTHVKGSGHEFFAALEQSRTSDVRTLFVTEDDAAQHPLDDALEHVLGGQSWRGELTVQVDDRLVPVSVLCVPRHDASGAVESFAIVARDISDLKQTQQRLAHLAMHDPLTGLANRLGLHEELTRELARWRRGELHGLALAFVDLDDFKEINDEFGHETGDHVLREVAARMLHGLRGDDVLGRIGGDEFVAVLGLQATGRVAVEQLASRLSAAFADPMLVGGRALHIGASVGVVTATAPDEDATALLARADAAMYEAKRSGKNQVRVA